MFSSTGTVRNTCTPYMDMLSSEQLLLLQIISMHLYSTFTLFWLTFLNVDFSKNYLIEAVTLIF